MQRIALVLACLACAGHAFNPSPTFTGSWSHAEGRNALSKVLMRESLKKAGRDLILQSRGPNVKQSLTKFADEHFPRHAKTAANLMHKMDAKELKRHVLAGAIAIATTWSSNVPAFAGEDVNPANIASNQGNLSNFASFLAVILGLSIPVVFLITLYIQSNAQGTATTFREPDSIGGTRFEDQ